MNPELLIGIPMFNSRGTVLKAIGSALAQIDVAHKVLVSDNASSDGGYEAIEREFGGVPNLEVVRHESNMGATSNYNWLLAEAYTNYFMWLSSDDWMDTRYAAQCIERLESDPMACLAFGQVHMLRAPSEEPFLTYSAKRAFLGSPSKRIRTVYRHFPDVYMYGVMRTRMAKATGGLPSVPAADIAFIRRLALVGSFINVPEAVFYYCPGYQWKSMDLIIANEGYDQKGQIETPRRGRRSIRLMMDSIKAIDESPMHRLDKAISLASVVAAEGERALKRILIDALGHFPHSAWRTRAGMRLHDRWFSKERPVIRDRDVYLNRVVLPSLRWSE